MFRRWTMNWLLAHGYGAIIQVLGACLLFGLLHGRVGIAPGLGGASREKPNE